MHIIINRDEYEGIANLGGKVGPQQKKTLEQVFGHGFLVVVVRLRGI